MERPAVPFRSTTVNRTSALSTDPRPPCPFEVPTVVMSIVVTARQGISAQFNCGGIKHRDHTDILARSAPMIVIDILARSAPIRAPPMRRSQT